MVMVDFSPKRKFMYKNISSPLFPFSSLIQFLTYDRVYLLSACKDKVRFRLMTYFHVRCSLYILFQTLSVYLIQIPSSAISRQTILFATFGNTFIVILPAFVYLIAFERICSIIKLSHFSSLATAMSVPS